MRNSSFADGCLFFSFQTPNMIYDLALFIKNSWRWERVLVGYQNFILILFRAFTRISLSTKAPLGEWMRGDPYSNSDGQSWRSESRQTQKQTHESIGCSRWAIESQLSSLHWFLGHACVLSLVLQFVDNNVSVTRKEIQFRAPVAHQSFSRWFIFFIMQNFISREPFTDFSPLDGAFEIETPKRRMTSIYWN